MRTALPGMRLTVTEWAAKGDTLLVEWVIRATLNNEPIEWEGVSRYKLRGELAIAEAVHFDSLPLWERLDPSMKRPGMLDAPEE